MRMSLKQTYIIKGYTILTKDKIEPQHIRKQYFEFLNYYTVILDATLGSFTLYSCNTLKKRTTKFAACAELLFY